MPTIRMSAERSADGSLTVDIPTPEELQIENMIIRQKIESQEAAMSTQEAHKRRN